MTDKEVILKIKSGEINYFEFLIKKYSRLLDESQPVKPYLFKIAIN